MTGPKEFNTHVFSMQLYDISAYMLKGTKVQTLSAFFMPQRIKGSIPLAK